MVGAAAPLAFAVAVSFFKPRLMPCYWFAFLPMFTDVKAYAIR